MEVPTYLTTQKAAKILNLSPRTLEKKRLTGDGPPYVKYPRRVMYDLADLIAWANSRKVRSTSDPGKAVA